MKPIALAIGALAVTLVGLFFALVQPGGDGVAAALRLPDGSEYMVSQKCNWSLEPYTVAFYMRPPGGTWGWCYIDHQATRWRDVVMTYDPASDTVTVTERCVWKAALDRKDSRFSIGDVTPKRSLTAPQEQRMPDYAFP